MEGLVYISENLHSSPFINGLMKFITRLGDGAFVWILFALLMLCFKKTRKGSLVMLVSLLIGFLINDFVFKFIFSRPRPFSVRPEFLDFLNEINLDAPSGYSFPSGHAFSSFNCAVVIMMFNKKLGYISIPLAVVISFSRIFMCVHYPTDVLAGMIMGIVVAVLVVFSYRKIVRAFERKKREKIRLDD